MQPPRVLLTGPVGELDEWSAAARTAGWEPLPWPLIEIEELAPAEDISRALAQAAPGHLCLTSVHAIPFLALLAAHAPALRALPGSLVGERSLARLRELGFTGALEAHASAEELRAALRARRPRPGRILWPRGDRSDELARGLRADGCEVLDPLAYRNRPRAPGPHAPECELVFFASPSAVQAWSQHGGEHSAPRALAIGSTTFQALLAEKQLAFFDIISLPEPTSGSFAAALQHIDLRPTP